LQKAYKKEPGFILRQVPYFEQGKPWQGLKPNSVFILYGPTKAGPDTKPKHKGYSLSLEWSPASGHHEMCT
jgi:hypothetical protein